jgi:N4-gp56 family major capsid protein
MAWPTDATGAQTVTTNAVFIPELWSDDVIAAYKKNLIVSNLVTKINHVGKKGDTIHIPKPGRGSANAKAATAVVTLNTDTATEITLSIDKHYEYSRLIEDIAGVQSIDSFRAFYTNDAGYALSTQVDNDLTAQWEGLQGGTVGANTWASAVIGGDGSTAYDQTANTNAGNGSTLTDAGIRKMIQTLDDLDVPQTDRVLVIPPVERNTLMGIARFTEEAFVGEAGPGNTIRNGQIGDLYGIKVFVTSNCPTETAADTTTTYRVGCLFHKDAIAHVEQMSVRSQTQYKQEFLADLFTADTIYGVGELRNEAGVAFVVPS